MAAWLLDHDSLDLAEYHLQTFLRTDKGKHKRWGAGAEYDLQCIAFRRSALANPVPFTPENMGASVNSPDDEYLPTLTADGHTLLFTRYNRPAMSEDFYYSRFTNGNWGKAIRMAERLKDGVRGKGIELYADSPTNQQFIILPEAKAAALAEKVDCEVWARLDGGRLAIRLVTSWHTREEEVDQLLALL